MLWGMRDHESTLADSERFYYGNYEYYNNYEDLDTDYQNDLSKIRFNIRRKSRALMVLYDTHSSSYSEQPTERLVRTSQPKRSHHCVHIREEPCTLDDLLFRFAQAYHQQNYCDLRGEREDAKDQLDVVILRYLYSFFEAQFAPDEEQSFAELKEVLEGLRAAGEAVRGRLEELYNRQEGKDLLERWFAFEQYWDYLLRVKLIADSKQDKIENFYLFEFCQYFKYFLTQIQQGAARSVLLLAQPETPLLSQLVHPLSIPLAYTLKANQAPPKILFLNLDGKETYLNLRVAASFPDTVRYISVFQEPKGADLIETSMEKGCQTFQNYADFVNINTAHSQLLFREIRPRDVDGTPLPHSENIFLYPLNSIHLRKAYSQARPTAPTEERRLPVLQGSDIRWLWDEVIARQAEEWTPDLTIISYNGFLDIPEEDFTDILRDVTALSDHRVLLFTNMTGLFSPPNTEFEDQSGEHDQERVELIQEFLSLYVPYRYDRIDQERFFNNLSQFVKVSSGSLSLKKRPKHLPQARFALGTRLTYLDRLATLPELEQVLPAANQGRALDRLFREFGRREVEGNRKENEWWTKKVEQVEAELLEMDPDGGMQEEGDGQSKEVAYRLKALKQELEVEELLVHGQMDTTAELKQYFSRKKQRLLLDNLESYRYRRFYTGEQEERGGRLRCYRFCLQQGEGQEILLERYSQVITDEKRTKVFVVNYRLGEERHIILQGEIVERGTYVRMKRVQPRLEESLNKLELSEKKGETLFINYSHCFAKDKLYLFWPQKWDLEEQLRRRFLGLTYSPPHVNEMLRLSYNVQERHYIVESLRWRQGHGIPPVPRRGCIGVQFSMENRFYILGGVYDSRLDYYSGHAGVSVAIVSEDGFIIEAAPKRKERQSKNSMLKPKMLYRVEKSVRTGDEGGSVMLSGGYGRAFTNFHSLFSLQGYSIVNELDGLKISRIQAKGVRLTKLSGPISAAAVGRFQVGSQGESEEKFSDCVKDWILGQGREERGGEREVVSVLEEEMRVREFKSDHKRNYLFGWDRTIRERIYVPHCWSPELQIVLAGRLYLVYTALKTQKSNSYNMGSFLIPKEEDLASLRLDQDRLLVLSNSPVLHSLDSKPNNYILYEGSLANINDLVTRRQLPMQERYQFRGPPAQQQSLKYKTVFTIDDRIFVLGGLGRGEKGKEGKEGHARQDYLLERHKDKLHGKVRRLECPDDSLELTSPVVVTHKDGFLLYSVVLQQRSVAKGEGAFAIQDFWRLKIETFTPNESCQEETLLSGPLLLYHLDFERGSLVSRRPQLEQPKLVKVVPYTRFSGGALRQVMEKVHVRVQRLEDQKFAPYLGVLRECIKEREEGRLGALLREHHHQGSTFRSLLTMMDFLLDEDKRERDNIENEELVRDLRSLSSLLNKHLIETVLDPEPTEAALHRFVMEDRSSRKVKYIAIGPLLTPRLKFLRIRYKHELSICLNEINEEELFFNTNVLACEEIAREKSRGNAVDWEQEPTTKKITVAYRN